MKDEIITTILVLIGGFIFKLLTMSWIILTGILLLIFTDSDSLIHKIGYVAVIAPLLWALVFSVSLIVHNKESEYELDDYSEDEPWDEESYLYHAYLEMSDKCGYGEEIDILTENERVIYLTQDLAMEVNNGGFYQYYENSSGDSANEVIGALKTLKAEKMLLICQKANAIFGESVPTDRDIRNKVLTRKVTFEQMRSLEECDNEFVEAYKEFTELSYQYLKGYEEKQSVESNELKE